MYTLYIGNKNYSTRFLCYGVAPTGEGAAYQRHLVALPAMQEWLADAMRESEHIARFDAPTALRTAAVNGMRRE